jgi:N6-L-threonylcarbamoyladenine synthase
MKKDLTFLGIETSCDETAASVVREDAKGNIKILSNVVSSQVDEHLKFGGVVPENAARSHAEKIDIIIKKAMNDSKCKFEELDGVAATAGPGLLVCLMVGLQSNCFGTFNIHFYKIYIWQFNLC